MTEDFASVGALVVATAIMVVASGALGLPFVAGRRSPRLALALGPAIGFAALVVLSVFSGRLLGPGGSAVLVGIAVLGAAGYGIFLLRDDRRVRASLGWVAAIGAGAVTVVLAALPFIANGRVGVLGVGVNNDMSYHLWQSEMLAIGSDAGIPWYPLGPHYLVASLGEGAGTNFVGGFGALSITATLVLALACLTVVRGLPLPARIILPPLCALPYLAGAYFAQGAFKEVMQAGFLLAAVLLVREAGGGGLRSARVSLAAGLIVGAAVVSYSLAGGVWIVAFAVAWVVFGAIAAGVTHQRGASGPRPSGAVRAAMSSIGGDLRSLVGPIVATVVVLAALAPEVSSYAEDSDSGQLDSQGNLPERLPLVEATPFYPVRDFRLPDSASFDLTLLGVGAGLLVLVAIAFAVTNNERAVLAGVASAFVIWMGLRLTTETYWDAKGLAIMAPLIAVLFVVGLRPAWVAASERWGRAALATGSAAAVALVALAYFSTVGVLSAGSVGDTTRWAELRGFGEEAGSSATILYLGGDDFAAFALASPNVTTLRALPPEWFVENEPYTWPSVDPQANEVSDLDRAVVSHFDYVVRPRDVEGTEVGSGERLVAETEGFELWESPTVDVADPPSVSEPVRVEVEQLLESGQSVDVELPGLEAGRWVLGVNYASPRGLVVTIDGRSHSLPPIMNEFGRSWPAATFEAPEGTSGVPVTIKVKNAPVEGLPAYVTRVVSVSAFPVSGLRRMTEARGRDGAIESVRMRVDSDCGLPAICARRALGR